VPSNHQQFQLRSMCNKGQIGGIAGEIGRVAQVFALSDPSGQMGAPRLRTLQGWDRGTGDTICFRNATCPARNPKTEHSKQIAETLRLQPRQPHLIHPKMPQHGIPRRNPNHPYAHQLHLRARFKMPRHFPASSPIGPRCPGAGGTGLMPRP
jgi:hypothetical protein